MEQRHRVDFGQPNPKAKPSPTIAFGEACKARQATVPRFISLGGGDAVGDPPPCSFAAWDDWLSSRGRRMGYDRSRGLAELNETYAAYVQRRLGALIRPENVISTSGGKEALGKMLKAIASRVDPFSEFVLFTPAWPSLAERVRSAGLVPIFTDLAGLEHALGTRTCGVLINTPRNPDGHVFSSSEVSYILEICERRVPGVFYLIDGVYHGNVYPGVEQGRILGDVEIARVGFIDSVSKRYAMAAHRVGFAVGAPELINDMASLQSKSTTHASLPAQIMALGAVSEEGDSFPVDVMQGLLPLRDQFVAWGRKSSVFSVIEPQGTIYLCIDASQLLGTRSGETELVDAEPISRALLEEEDLGLMFGTPFGGAGTGLLRANLMQCSGLEQVDEVCSRLESFASRCN